MFLEVAVMLSVNEVIINHHVDVMTMTVTVGVTISIWLPSG